MTVRRGIEPHRGGDGLRCIVRFDRQTRRRGDPRRDAAVAISERPDEVRRRFAERVVRIAVRQPTQAFDRAAAAGRRRVAVIRRLAVGEVVVDPPELAKRQRPRGGADQVGERITDASRPVGQQRGGDLAAVDRRTQPRPEVQERRVVGGIDRAGGQRVDLRPAGFPHDLGLVAEPDAGGEVDRDDSDATGRFDRRHRVGGDAA